MVTSTENGYVYQKCSRMKREKEDIEQKLMPLNVEE
jgi:hypothetical protein